MFFFPPVQITAFNLFHVFFLSLHFLPQQMFSSSLFVFLPPLVFCASPYIFCLNMFSASANFFLPQQIFSCLSICFLSHFFTFSIFPPSFLYVFLPLRMFSASFFYLLHFPPVLFVCFSTSLYVFCLTFLPS